MAEYTAITIGPIYKTLQLTSSPAGLWAASSMMSWVAKSILEYLHEQGVEEEQFVSPYCAFDGKGNVILGKAEDICEQMRGKGVGLFHDRIICIGNHWNKAQAAIEAVEKELAEKLKCGEAWVHNFLRVYAMGCDVPEEQAPLLYLGKRLSAMELEATFPCSEKDNPLLKLFENASIDGTEKRGYSNTGIKASFLVSGLKNWMFYKYNGEQIRDLADIANCGGTHDSTRKYSKYYAILSSDGDSMSKCLEKLTAPLEIRAFSEKCLQYCAEAANVILQYDGMPIYAGGDDLLAILPVVGKNGNIFDLIETLRGIFNKIFKADRDDLDGKPTISFGISVQYYKSPLFEALDRSRGMLWQAKQGEKNALYIDLQKHSGQSAKLELKKLDSYETNAVMEQLRQLIGYAGNTAEERAQMAFSFGQKVEQFETLFAEALKSEDDTLAVNLLENLFDNEDQKKFKAYLFAQRELIIALKKAGYEPVNQLKGISRILHFMFELEGGNSK